MTPVPVSVPCQIQRALLEGKQKGKEGKRERGKEGKRERGKEGKRERGKGQEKRKRKGKGKGSHLVRFPPLSQASCAAHLR